MKLFILIIIAGIGCSPTNNMTQQLEELETLKSKYETLTEELDNNGKSLDREVLKEKQNEAIALETKIKTTEKQIEEVVVDLTYNKSYKGSKERQAFKIREVKQMDQNISIDVHYSGCGGLHFFELISNGTIDEKGVVDFYLVDNTKGDHCKMLIMKTKKFDISKISKKSQVNGFRINNSEVKSFSRSN